MKKNLRAAAFLCSLLIPAGALASDLPTSHAAKPASPVPAASQPPEAAYSEATAEKDPFDEVSGLRIGVYGGYSLLRSVVDKDSKPFMDIDGDGKQDTDPSSGSLLGGVSIEYNVPISGGFFAGLGLMGEFANISQKMTTVSLDDTQRKNLGWAADTKDNKLSYKNSLDINYAGMAYGQLGFGLGHILLGVRGGLALANASLAFNDLKGLGDDSKALGTSQAFSTLMWGAGGGVFARLALTKTINLELGYMYKMYFPTSFEVAGKKKEIGQTTTAAATDTVQLGTFGFSNHQVTLGIGMDF